MQRSNENAHAFACRCVALKKKVQYMSETEGIPFDMENLNSTFFKTIYTGLKQNNIRHELRQTLMEATISDDNLLLVVSEACGNEEERQKKMNEGTEKTAKMNKLTAGSDSDEPDTPNSSSSEFSSDFPSIHNQNPQNTSSRKKAKAKKKDPSASASNLVNNSGPASSADLNKLTAAFKEMTASNAKLTAEVNVLKEMAAKPSVKTTAARAPNPTSATNNGNNFSSILQRSNMSPFAGTFAPVNPTGQVRPRGNFRAPFRCQSCTSYNVPYCSHCLKCCGEGHKIKDCPLN